jgi:type IV fimbrial biogenesis protein FimT
MAILLGMRTPLLLPATAAGASRGFSMIELLVTMALLAILMGVAVPSFRAFQVNSQVSNLANEFVLGASYARATAISRNRCVTMCISTDPNADAPVCSTSATDWNAGWIIFANQKCDDNPSDTTAELLKQYVGDTKGPTMTPASTQRSVRFDSRGLGSLSSSNQFNVAPVGASFTKTICISSAGRARIIDALSTCSGSV